VLIEHASSKLDKQNFPQFFFAALRPDVITHCSCTDVKTAVGKSIVNLKSEELSFSFDHSTWSG